MWAHKAILSTCLLLGTVQSVSAQSTTGTGLSETGMTRRVVVEPLPTLKDVDHVAASMTHSGYPVPRYVSLKFGKVNGRQGPSLQHPALWQYRRRGLPLVVVAEMDIWRKVRDANGDESWMRTQALSGVRNVMAVSDVPLRTKPKQEGRVAAIASKDAILRLKECDSNGWCDVRSSDGLKGWARQSDLWGAAPLK